MSENFEEYSFEELMEKLEEIACELEKGNLNLDESVSKFEEGMKVSKECTTRLDDAEKRISILLQDGDNIVEEEFAAE